MSGKELLKDGTNFDKVGCLVVHLGEMIAELDQFADENGDIRIQDLNTAIKFGSMLYTRVKTAYETCLGKELVFEGESTFVKLANMLLALIDSLEAGNIDLDKK